LTKQNSQKAKPTVAVIGAGRLGQAFAIALQSAGYPVIALVARHPEKAEKAARIIGKRRSKTNPTPLAFGAKDLAKLPDTDLVMITTPDDAIAETAHKLSELWSGKLRHDKGRRTVLHTSGALSSEALAPLAERGFQTGSIHPLVSISESVSGAKALHGAFFCIEGTRQAKRLAAAIVHDLRGSSFTIEPASKALYHAAAVMAAPHLTALVDVATEMLARCGLSKSKAQQVFMPLLESTINNLKTSDPQQALTGTFARGDVATVRRHLGALSGRELKEARELYKLLGLHSLKLAEKNGLDRKLVATIKKLLEAK
jgi:predicted short-subunit dehydrogenase-like oxidoreductase (DUF2520 family)